MKVPKTGHEGGKQEKTTAQGRRSKNESQGDSLSTAETGLLKRCGSPPQKGETQKKTDDRGGGWEKGEKPIMSEKRGIERTLASGRRGWLQNRMGGQGRLFTWGNRAASGAGKETRK